MGVTVFLFSAFFLEVLHKMKLSAITVSGLRAQHKSTYDFCAAQIQCVPHKALR